MDLKDTDVLQYAGLNNQIMWIPFNELFLKPASSCGKSPAIVAHAETRRCFDEADRDQVLSATS